MTDLVLLGASGVTHEIIDTVFDINEAGEGWRLLGIIDDDEGVWDQIFYRDVRVLGGPQRLGELDLSQTEFLGAFGAPATYLKRARLIEAALARHCGLRFARIVHPSAYVSPTSRIGEGTYIGPGAVVDALAQVGRHCLVLFHSIVSRRVRIGDYSFVSATVNITGNKTIGRCAFLGVNSTINANLGEHVLVGAGTLVSQDVVQYSIVSNARKQDVISFPSTSQFEEVIAHLR